jgi:DNA-binding CsgD family transcriptional regulator
LLRFESKWGLAFDAARTMKPAETWRSELAQRAREASGAHFAAVCTCPPGMFLEAQATAVPEGFTRVIEQILEEYLPDIERSGEGAAAMSAQFGSGAYAPVDLTNKTSLAARYRREILGPEGIQGLVNAFMLSSRKEVLGWLALGTREPSAEALNRVGPALTKLAAIASATLEMAIDLASGCGVVTRGAPAERLLRLTNRQLQVARLVARGASDAEVAERLEMAEQTVGTHLHRIYRKLGVRTRLELASQLGLLA